MRVLRQRSTPNDLESVRYCAQRIEDDGKNGRRATTYKYLAALLEDRGLRSLPDEFDYGAYFIDSAPDRVAAITRRAAMHPLANVAGDGAVAWIVDGIVVAHGDVVHSGVELRKIFSSKSATDGMGGERFYEPPATLPYACDGACCDYALTVSRPSCVVGANILDRVCFDASGAATDYYLHFDSEADPILHPDEP